MTQNAENPFETPVPGDEPGIPGGYPEKVPSPYEPKKDGVPDIPLDDAEAWADPEKNTPPGP